MGRQRGGTDSAGISLGGMAAAQVRHTGSPAPQSSADETDRQWNTCVGRREKGSELTEQLTVQQPTNLEQIGNHEPSSDAVKQ